MVNMVKMMVKDGQKVGQKFVIIFLQQHQQHQPLYRVSSLYPHRHHHMIGSGGANNDKQKK
jgi:hypothetical protein